VRGDWCLGHLPVATVDNMDAEALAWARQAQEQLMQAVSIGVGTYLSMLLSLYFAAVGVKNFLAAKAIEPSVVEKTHRAAA